MLLNFYPFYLQMTQHFQFSIMANSALEKSSPWFKANKLTLNLKKTKYMMFSYPNMTARSNKLQIGSQHIEQVGTNCKEKYDILNLFGIL